MRINQVIILENDPCWKDYKQIGMKKKNGKSVPNCVPKESVNEFALPGGDDREPDEEEILKKLAAQWWLGTEQQMAKAQRTLASMGWEIGQDESGDDDAGVFVIRAGDVNGNSYMAFNHSDLELTEDVAEDFNGEYDDEAGMADNNIETMKRAVDGLDDLIHTGDNLPEWCQEKIAVAKSMLVTVWDYMASEEENMSEGEQKKGKDYIDPIEADYDDDYQDMVKRVGQKAKQQELAKKKQQEKSKELGESTNELNNILKLSGHIK